MRSPSLQLLVSGCTALATGPSWTHSSLADTAPERIAAEDARLKAEAAARAREPKTIGAKHILIMPDKSERKPPEIHRTREEAKKRAEECLAKVRSGADFDKLVVEYTDEPGGAERKGDLSTFEKKTMVKAFGDAAFALEVRPGQQHRLRRPSAFTSSSAPSSSAERSRAEHVLAAEPQSTFACDAATSSMCDRVSFGAFVLAWLSER